MVARVHVMVIGVLLSFVVCLSPAINQLVSSQGVPSPLVIPNPIPQPGAWFGYWVSTGDLNHDGVSDLVVGAYFADVAGQRDAGRVDVFLGGSNFTGSVAVSYHAPTPQAGGEFGVGVAIGDVNGDGFADLIVGSEGAQVGALEGGRVFVYFGGPTLPDAIPDLILQAPQPQDKAEFGRRVALGDINGDGAMDILVGAHLADVGGQRDAGEVDVFLGGRTIDAIADAQLRATTPQANALFGFSVVAGDINADGFDDIIVGALLTDVAELTDAGRAEVFFGGASLPRTSALTLEAPNPQAGARFGFPVDVGDVNGDGVTDLLIGAYFTNVGNRLNAGKAFIYLGGRSFHSIPDYELASPQPRMGARFGYSFAVGDVIGDRRPDLVVGSDLANLGPLLANAGEAVIYDGGVPFDGASAGPLQAPEPQRGGSYGFRLAVADLNDDGRRDLIVTAIGTAVNSQREAGAVFVYLSRSSR